MPKSRPNRRRPRPKRKTRKRRPQQPESVQADSPVDTWTDEGDIWVDYDADPQTPLTSLGISGIPDGTPFEFTYLVPSDAERPAAAKIIQTGLAGCGIGVQLISGEWDEPGRGSTSQSFGRGL